MHHDYPDIAALVTALAVLDRLLTLPVGEQSDGYHTFNELYDHRITLFLAFAAEVDARCTNGFVWRSKLHSDGSAFEGWFVMGIGAAPGEQITYHLPMSRWEEAGFALTLAQAWTFDGHTSADVLMRLRRYYE